MNGKWNNTSNLALIIVGATVCISLLFLTNFIDLTDGRPFRAICERTLEGQVKAPRVSIVRVRANTTGDYAPDSHTSFKCVHNVFVLDRIKTSWQVPGQFLISETGGAGTAGRCHSAGSEFLVVLHELSKREKVKTCQTSAIVEVDQLNEVKIYILEQSI